MNFTINHQQLTGELETLASFSAVSAPAVTRVVYSEEDRQARRFLKKLFAEAGLEIREDAVGNTFARWCGPDASLPVVATGSHIDAIPNAGKYDGTVGVLGGLEAIRALQRAGFQPTRPIELVLFTSEEPTRFGIGCLGSRLLSGTLSAEAAHSLKDAEGMSLDQLREQSGFTGRIEEVPVVRGSYSHFVELHIEQGAILNRESMPIGIVQSIAAPASLDILIAGEGGHAGGVLMPDRKDAFMAAAEIALALESFAKSTGSADTVATCGICEVFPGAINSIPSRVKLGIDLRDIDGDRRDALLQSFLAAVSEIGERRSVHVQHHLLNVDAPARSDEHIVDVIRAACDTFRIGSRSMVSRAYHDSLFMARIAPVAMIFIPCRNGVSHRPDEYAAPEDIATGVRVLAETLTQLSTEEMTSL